MAAGLRCAATGDVASGADNTYGPGPQRRCSGIGTRSRVFYRGTRYVFSPKAVPNRP
jgi:hypothetical protein